MMSPSMKKLIIVRHAKSSWNHPELSDFDRPLNSRGNKDAEMMSLKLSEKINKIDFIISSSSKRTILTYEYFKNKINFNNELFTDELYHASSKTVISIIKDTNSDINSLMLLGHNPGLTETVNYLTNHHLYNLPTTGIIIVKFNVSSWSKISELDKKGNLEWIKFPKDYKL
ncbi:MAG: phosphohistidine phosphatase [Cytophagia bacterium]|nr:phosphohistidine phosphatase [Cytophagia bacterium]